MSLFEWLQVCSIEEFAKWLIAFQKESENNIIRQIMVSKGKKPIGVVTLREDLQLKEMFDFLNQDLDD